ncbi:unnamed protein product [Effrenium voratum]|uniref:Uncharacterized protein n=1 Tax=Effrenium voratum TaxID=2562239 RepID=A0AA36ISP9_9DINO|nr:unnamed protein product [Effrenium voratum]
MLGLACLEENKNWKSQQKFKYMKFLEHFRLFQEGTQSKDEGIGRFLYTNPTPRTHGAGTVMQFGGGLCFVVLNSEDQMMERKDQAEAQHPAQAAGRVEAQAEEQAAWLQAEGQEMGLQAEGQAAGLQAPFCILGRKHWAALASVLAIATAIRVEDEDMFSFNSARTAVKEEEFSTRTFDFRGFSDTLTFTFANGSNSVISSPFFSIAGKAQTNPCKIVMYRSAKRVLLQPVQAVRDNNIMMAKAQLVEYCKSFRTKSAELKKVCEDLELHTEAGRWKALGQAAEPQAEETAAHDEEESGSSSTSTAPLQSDAVLTTIQNAVQSYSCMVNEGDTLASSPVKRGKVRKVLSGTWNMMKGAVSTVSNAAKGGAVKRMARHIAGYSGPCPPIGNKCNNWKKLLDIVMAGKPPQPDSCETFLTEMGLMELKGDPSQRLGSVDLSSLKLPGKNRTLVMSQVGGLKLTVQNEMSRELVTEVRLGSRIDGGYADISNTWEELTGNLTKRMQQCQVEKVGVFNMGLKKRWNGFQLGQRFPWKVTFLSNAAIQIHSKHGHGSNYGYDLHGDPEEMERPCKWMARARARGYRPRRRLMPVADLDFSNSEKTKIHLPKSLYEPSNGTSMLWVDEEGKFPIPEWIRGMRRMTNLNKTSTPSWMLVFSDGRDLNHYKQYVEKDVRGLHEASESSPVLAALLSLGWTPDPIVKVEEDQSESAQLSGAMVNSVFPYNKQLAGLQSLPTNGGENKLFSIYDYTESYAESCFQVEAMSLPSADDGASDLGGQLTATIGLCTNNWVSSERKNIPSSSQVTRQDVMAELRRYFAQGKPAGMEVSDTITRSCYSEADCTGNTCMMPGDCKENTDSPCPVGYGCGCDTAKTQTIFMVAVAASVLSEGTRNAVLLGPSMITACQAFATAGAAATGGASLALVPLCPVLVPLMFYAIAPLGSDVFMAFILASIIGGLNPCGCVKLSCEASARISNRVCRLEHPQEKEMINEYHFVPPPNEKCVPTFAGCKLDTCDASETQSEVMGWVDQQGKAWGRSIGIYNCKTGETSISRTSR